MAELRLETYREFSWPHAMKGFFQNNGLLVALITALSVMVVSLLTLLFQGHDVVFGTHTGAGAFYRVIPYAAMVVPFMALAIMVLVSLWKGFANQWRAVGGTPEELKHWPAHRQAIWDVLRLKYLDGGGYGCNYPDDRFSMIRRYLHHAVFYGFMLCLASTTVAFGLRPSAAPASPLSLLELARPPGNAGGAGAARGNGGLLYLKRQMDRDPAAPETLGMDMVFTVLLFLTSLTGLLLLCLRATPLMGTLLIVHIGFVLGLFITMPYGKFVHGFYRYGALVKNAIEQAREND
jgi:citrate/tricarballylate utilization protein